MTGRRAAWLLAAFLLVAAPPAAAEFEPDSAGMSDTPLTVEQERAIADTLVNRLTRAWDQVDLDEWTAQFWPDAGAVTMSGEILTDRNEMRERVAALWSGIFKGARLKLSIRKVRGLGTAALEVDADAEIKNYASRPAGISARSDGALAARTTLILLNRFGRWRVFSSQSTPVRPDSR